MEESGAKYKQAVDKKRRYVKFDVGDLVWAILTKDCIPVGEYNKHFTRKIGLLEIIEKINSNASHLKLLSHIRTTNVFNVKHLIPYSGENSSSNEDVIISGSKFLTLREDNGACIVCDHLTSLKHTKRDKNHQRDKKHQRDATSTFSVTAPSFGHRGTNCFAMAPIVLLEHLYFQHLWCHDIAFGCHDTKDFALHMFSNTLGTVTPILASLLQFCCLG